LAALATVEAGQKLGRYHLHCQLATGGMASVYLASLESAAGLGKLVAVKQIHDHLSQNKEFVHMFMDEARLISRIEHPNVCGVYEFGREEGSYLLTMEYLSGVTLRGIINVLRRQSGSEPAFPYVMAMISQSAEGLHAAHELRADDGTRYNLIHRDLSPQNLFVTFEGVTKLLDFGVAHAANKLHQTKPGVVKGKFAYMAPEYLRRKEEVDHRVDVWSLGVVLWELLTLRSLFKRDVEAETISALLTEDIPAPSSINEQVPKELDAIVLKALAREPKERYQTARELSMALRQLSRKLNVLMGSVELEVWLGELIPEEKHRQLELARTVRESTTARHRLAPELGSLPPRSSASLPAIDVTISEAPTRVASPRRVAMPLVAALAVLGIGIGAYAAFANTDQVEPPQIAGTSAAAVPIDEATLDLDGEPGQANEQAPVRADEASSAQEETTVAATTDENTPVLEPTEPASPAPAAVRRRGRQGSATRMAARNTAAPTPSVAAEPVAPAEAAEAPTPEQETAAPPAVEPVAAAPAPVPEPEPPAPAPAVRPTPTPIPRPAPRLPPALDARVRITGMDITGSLPTSTVQQAVSRLTSGFRQCYQRAAQSARRDRRGAVSVSMQINEVGRARNARASGGPLPGIAACVQERLGSVRTRQRPDTGRVQVRFSVSYVPLPPRR